MLLRSGKLKLFQGERSDGQSIGVVEQPPPSPYPGDREEGKMKAASTMSRFDVTTPVSICHHPLSVRTAKNEPHP
jgi:hypothetical protein